MATVGSSVVSNKTPYARLGHAAQNTIPMFLQEVLFEYEKPKDISSRWHKNGDLIKRLKSSDLTKIKDAINKESYKEFDIPLIYTILRNIYNEELKPTRGWDSTIDPQPHETRPGDDIERCRRRRNKIIHRGNTEVSNHELNEYFDEFGAIASRLQDICKKQNNEFVSEIEDLRTCCMDEDTERRYLEEIKEWRCRGIDYEEHISQLKEHLLDGVNFEMKSGRMNTYLKERNNFQIIKRLIFDNAKNGFAELIDKNLSIIGTETFEDFINRNQHAIYHLCSTINCCQCPSTNAYHEPEHACLDLGQLNPIFDQIRRRKTCKTKGSSSVCCALAKMGIKTSEIDITLAKCLLVKFCLRVFWYSCLENRGKTLEEFLNDYKHTIYHLYENVERCCLCPIQKPHTLPKGVLELKETDWLFLYSSRVSPCSTKQHRRNVKYTICTALATPGISVNQLNLDVSRLLLKYCCPLWKTVENLSSMRNVIEKHTKLTDTEFSEYKAKLEYEILIIAYVCNTDIPTKNKLHDLYNMPSFCHITKKLDEIEDRIEQQSIKNEESKKEIIDMICNTEIQQNGKRQKILEYTREAIRIHLEKNNFIVIKAVKFANECIREYNVMVLTGPPGSGKSRIGLELLNILSMDGKFPLLLNKIEDYTEIVRENCVILLDDTFGKTSCSFDHDKHCKILECMEIDVSTKKTQLIVTMRENIENEMSDIIDMSFFIRHRVELGSEEFKMNQEEKMQCFKRYCELNNIEETDDRKQENYKDKAILNESMTVYLHKSTNHKIVDEDFGKLLGFPQACYLFTSNRKYTRQGVAFFSHASEIMLKEVENLRNAGNSDPYNLDYVILVFILLHGNCINLFSLNIDEIVNIRKTINPNMLISVSMFQVQDSVHRLHSRFIQEIGHKTYTFQHRSIAECVMISYSIIDAQKVIPLLTVDFILEMTRPETYKPIEGEVIFTVPVYCYGVFAERLKDCLVTTYYTKPYTFLKCLCEAPIIRLSGNDIIEKLVLDHSSVTLAEGEIFDCFIADQRFFIGKNLVPGEMENYLLHTFVLYGNEWYLPCCLFMFCASDKNILNFLQCFLFKKINCGDNIENLPLLQKTLVTALNYAICIGDIYRMDIILSVIKLVIRNTETKISSLDTFTFVLNVINLQGLLGLELMFSKIEITNIIDIQHAFDEIFDRLLVLQCTITTDMENFIMRLEDRFRPIFKPCSKVLNYICECGSFEFIKTIIKIIDTIILNDKKSIEEIILHCKIDVVKWMIDEYDEKFDKMFALTIACEKRYHLAKWILNTIEFSAAEMKQAMNSACKNYEPELSIWMFGKFDRNLFDIDQAIMHACENDNPNLAFWMFKEFNLYPFRIDKVIESACKSDTFHLATWIFKNCDNSKIDLRSTLNAACQNVNPDLAKWMIDKFHTSCFDLKSAMNIACQNTSLLSQWMFIKFDTSLFNIKEAMNWACKNKNQEHAKWIFKKFQKSSFDSKSAIEIAFTYENYELAEWIKLHNSHQSLLG